MKAIAFLFLSLLSSVAFAQEQGHKQSPPDFASGYLVPHESTPLPRAEMWAYVDAALLIITLALAADFALRQRSRSGIKMLSLFSLGYFGFYRQGCICPIGAIQNVTIAAFDKSYALPLVGALFFLMPLLFALFFGRVFCAAVCPLGAAQDVVLQKARRVPPALEHALGLVPYFFLGAAIFFAATGTAFLICRFDPFIPFFRLGGSYEALALGATLLILSTFVGRPYCRFLCPYGVLLRWTGALARWPVTITPQRCTNCHLCADECPFGAIRPPVIETKNARPALRKQVTIYIFLLPFFIGAGAALGYLAAPHLALQNRTVALAARVWNEEKGTARGSTKESEAFAKQGGDSVALYREALQLRAKFSWGAALFGAWCGLVIGLKLLSLSRLPHNAEYKPDGAACLACARCYASCPIEHEQRANVGLYAPGEYQKQVQPRFAFEEKNEVPS
jgi:NosR/NirI family transcriptional regulator, nitrous oxide reductase regulator